MKQGKGSHSCKTAVVQLFSPPAWQTDEILPASCHGGGTLPANDRLGARRRAERGIQSTCTVAAHCEALASHLEGRGETILLGPSGTGHAISQARAFLERFRGGDVFLLNGNIPLIDADTIRSAFDAHKRAGNAATILAAFVKNSNGYPHIARSADGAFAGILAEQDANETGREVFAAPLVPM